MCIFFSDGLNIIMGKNCFDSDLFKKICELLLKMFVIFMKSLKKKTKNEPLVI